jgi:hypothetical protein
MFISEVVTVIVVGSTPQILKPQRATGFRNLTQTFITGLHKLNSDNDSEACLISKPACCFASWLGKRPSNW